MGQESQETGPEENSPHSLYFRHPSSSPINHTSDCQNNGSLSLEVSSNTRTLGHFLHLRADTTIPSKQNQWTERPQYACPQPSGSSHQQLSALIWSPAGLGGWESTVREGQGWGYPAPRDPEYLQSRQRSLHHLPPDDSPVGWTLTTVPSERFRVMGYHEPSGSWIHSVASQ